MKNFLKTFSIGLVTIIGLVFLAQTSFASIGAGFTATSTDKGFISPTPINGNTPSIKAPCFSTDGVTCITSGGASYPFPAAGNSTTTLTNFLGGVGATTINATSTATSTITNFGSVLYAANFAGSDIYAKANAAYTWAVSNQYHEVTIQLPNGKFSVSTGFLCNVNGFRCLLKGQPGGGTEINYTGTGTSTQVDSGIQSVGIQHASGCGVQDITLVGNNTSTSSPQVGLAIEGPNGSDCTDVQHVDISGFGQGVVTGKNVYFFTMRDSVVARNGQAWDSETANNSGEDFSLYNVKLIDCANHDPFNCVNLENYATTEFNMFGGALDDSQLHSGFQNGINLYGVNYETPDPGFPAYTPIVLDNSSFTTLNISGGFAVQDATTTIRTPSTFIQANSATVNIDSLTGLLPSGSPTNTTIPTLVTGSGAVTWAGFNNTAGFVTNVINTQGIPTNGSTPNAKTIIGTLDGVPNADTESDAERGAQTNDAYNSLTSTGGQVTFNNGVKNYTTPITINTQYKPGLIHCNSGGGGSAFGLGGGTTLIYTPTTGSALTFNTNNYVVAGTGVENCDIQGTNGTTARSTIGVNVGGSSGGFANQLNSVVLSGFGTGVQYNSNTSFDSINNSVVNFNGRNYDEPNKSGANCENMRGLEDVFADANNQAGGDTDLYGFDIQQSGNCQSNFGFSSFDDNQIYYNQFGGTANINTLVADHQEDPNLHTYDMITTNSGGINIVTNLIGGDAMNDNTSGQPQQFSVSGQINLIGFTSDSNNNVTVPVTRIVNSLASSTIITWDGLSCKGANITSSVYANVPCSPFGVGSDYGQPSLYVASSTGTNSIGNVGIQNSNPSKMLTIGTGTNGTLQVSTSTTGCATFSSTGEIYSTGTGCGSGGGSGTVGTGTQGQFPFYNAGGTTLTATSTLFISQAGNIGIGSSSPSVELTEQVPAINATREKLAQFNVSDDPSTVFLIGNGTTNNGVFSPAFIGFQGTDVTKQGEGFIGELTSGVDSGSTSVVQFNAREMTGDVLNGTTGSITTRPLFDWDNNGTAKMTMTANGFLGIGTTTPTAVLSIDNASSTAGTSQTTPFGFLLGMAIDGVERMVESLDYYGHQYFSGPAPTVSGGTSSMNSPSNDNAGSINVIGTALTSVTMTFAHPWLSAPSCQEGDNVLAVGSDVTSISSTQVVFGFGTGGVSSATIWYRCTGVR